jgi:hypothetical protein
VPLLVQRSGGWEFDPAEKTGNMVNAMEDREELIRLDATLT